MYGYIYMTTNLVNGKRYIGQHKSSEFTESYKGSGKFLWKAINKYGWDNFKVEMLEECNSQEELNEKERFWIKHYDAVKSDKFYNILDGGFGGSQSGEYNGMLGKFHSEETKQKMSIAQSGSKNSFYGRHHSEETKKILREKCKSHLYGNKYNLGRHHSEETKQKMSIAQKNVNNKPPSCKGKKFINNGQFNKLVSEQDLNSYLCEGWLLGRISFSKRNLYVNNGIINKRVSEEEIEQYLNNGWFRGRLVK